MNSHQPKRDGKTIAKGIFLEDLELGMVGKDWYLKKIGLALLAQRHGCWWFKVLHWPAQDKEALAYKTGLQCKIEESCHRCRLQ